MSAARALPFWLADEAAVDGRHAGERVDAHRVVERHDAERALAPCVAALQRLRDGAGVVVALRARHALGTSGGPRGVEDQGEVTLGWPRADVPGVARRPSDRRTAPCPRAPRRDRRTPAARRGRRRRRARPARCRPQQRHPRAAVLEHVAHLAGGERGSSRACGTAAIELERPVREDVLEAVAQRDEDPVAGGDAASAERRGRCSWPAPGVWRSPGGAGRRPPPRRTAAVRRPAPAGAPGS